MSVGDPAAPADPTPAETLRRSVARIWEARRGSVFEHVAAIEDAVAALGDGRLDETTRSEVERRAHKLAGSLGTFGFTQGSVAASEIEAIMGRTDLRRGDAAALSDLAADLRAELERGPGGSTGAGRDAGPDPGPGGSFGVEVEADARTFLIVSGESELAARLAEEARARGLGTEVSLDIDDARAAVRRRRPYGVLLDLDWPSAPDAGLELMGELSQLSPPPPVIVMTSREDLADRVATARHGGSGFISKALKPHEIIERCLEVAAPFDDEAASVLAVDDDPIVLDLLSTLLGRDGISLTTLDDPTRFWEVLEATAPDLLLLDLDMPDVSGIELCRAIRGDVRWRNLPVVFLTKRRDPDTVMKVFDAGADDFVSKPIVGPELSGRIANRLERIRFYRLLADRDGLTGVSTRRKSVEAIERLVGLAGRFGQPLCVAVIDLDHFKGINDLHGHPAGDQVLRSFGQILLSTFRGEDVVGRWGGEEFVVAMYGLTRDGGERRLADVLEAFHGKEFSGEVGTFRATFSAGVAQTPGDGADVQALYKAADAALLRAKAQGRARVLTTTGS